MATPDATPKKKKSLLEILFWGTIAVGAAKAVTKKGK